MSTPDWSKLSISALRAECKSRSIPATGKKTDLVDKLIRHEIALKDKPEEELENEEEEENSGSGTETEENGVECSLAKDDQKSDPGSSTHDKHEVEPGSTEDKREVGPDSTEVKREVEPDSNGNKHEVKSSTTDDKHKVDPCPTVKKMEEDADDKIKVEAGSGDTQIVGSCDEQEVGGEADVDIEKQDEQEDEERSDAQLLADDMETVDDAGSGPDDDGALLDLDEVEDEEDTMKMIDEVLAEHGSECDDGEEPEEEDDDDDGNENEEEVVLEDAQSGSDSERVKDGSEEVTSAVEEEEAGQITKVQGTQDDVDEEKASGNLSVEEKDARTKTAKDKCHQEADMATEAQASTTDDAEDVTTEKDTSMVSETCDDTSETKVDAKKSEAVAVDAKSEKALKDVDDAALVTDASVAMTEVSAAGDVKQEEVKKETDKEKEVKKETDKEEEVKGENDRGQKDSVDIDVTMEEDTDDQKEEYEIVATDPNKRVLITNIIINDMKSQCFIDALDEAYEFAMCFRRDSNSPKPPQKNFGFVDLVYRDASRAEAIVKKFQRIRFGEMHNMKITYPVTPKDKLDYNLAWEYQRKKAKARECLNHAPPIPDSQKLVVTNLPPSTSEAMLRSMFSAATKVFRHPRDEKKPCTGLAVLVFDSVTKTDTCKQKYDGMTVDDGDKSHKLMAFSPLEHRAHRAKTAFTRFQQVVSNYKNSKRPIPPTMTRKLNRCQRVYNILMAEIKKNKNPDDAASSTAVNKSQGSTNKELKKSVAKATDQKKTPVKKVEANKGKDTRGGHQQNRTSSGPAMRKDTRMQPRRDDRDFMRNRNMRGGGGMRRGGMGRGVVGHIGRPPSLLSMPLGQMGNRSAYSSSLLPTPRGAGYHPNHQQQQHHQQQQQQHQQQQRGMMGGPPQGELLQNISTVLNQQLQQLQHLQQQQQLQQAANALTRNNYGSGMAGGGGNYGGGMGNMGSLSGQGSGNRFAGQKRSAHQGGYGGGGGNYGKQQRR
ncbi:PREDICTED: uncharacterized protein LOC106810393 isoform X2 [Priapulus caudatus]|uniref:Uncharacterized protein LOC106810393 isoform X2 n=1 Tax=Priapulus caudatus TaxID=37621 RepID=A0ABM1EAK1_PRICU|nr:PREDICTED: uncharacterized protein LOC106810393 isoform X2 [Priapulus caudatus]